MKNLIRKISILYCLFYGLNLFGQQLPLYSLFFINSGNLNPANTGILDVSKIYITNRRQWIGFNAAPKFISVSGEFKTNYRAGFGFSAFNDASGGAFTQTGFSLCYGYCVELNSQSKVSFGLSAIVNQYSFDYLKVKSLAPNDPAITQNINKSVVPDASAGIIYSLCDKLKIGIASQQLIQTRMSDFNSTNNFNKLIRHNLISVSYKILIDSNLEIEPSVLVRKTQASPYQTDMNVKLTYKKYAWMGISYRPSEAIAAMLGINYQRLFVCYGYDFLTSRIGSFSSGSHEIILGYNFANKKVKEPKIIVDTTSTNNYLNDRDHDGISDSIDACPDTYGSIKNKGCPLTDSDGDGVYDNYDNCPNTKGDLTNNGCPVVTEKQKDIVSKAIANLEFETNSAKIKNESLLGLDMLALLLSDKSDWKIKLSGHTDDVGSEESNLELSKNRAEAIRDYLVSKGISQNRIIVEYFGKTRPIATNETDEGRKLNRRVEMVFIFE